MNKLSKLVSLFLIFVMPIYTIFDRYQTEEKIVTVNQSLSPVATLFILIIAGMALWFVSNQFLEMVKQNKFGWLSIIFFGTMLAIILFGAWFIVNSITLMAQQSLEDFIATFAYHKKTLEIITMWIAGGVGFGVINVLVRTDLGKAAANKLKKNIT